MIKGQKRWLLNNVYIKILLFLDYLVLFERKKTCLFLHFSLKSGNDKFPDTKSLKQFIFSSSLSSLYKLVKCVCFISVLGCLMIFLSLQALKTSSKQTHISCGNEAQCRWVWYFFFSSDFYNGIFKYLHYNCIVTNEW